MKFLRTKTSMVRVIHGVQAKVKKKLNLIQMLGLNEAIDQLDMETMSFGNVMC